MSLQEQQLTVTKHNLLNEASYRLTLDERRLILISIASIYSGEKIPNEIKIKATDFASMWDLSPKLAYKQLKEAKDNLYERSLRLKRIDTEEVWDIRWVDAVAYQDGEGYVKLSFSESIKPYLSELKGHFTTYRLAEIKHFKSGHSIRLYELLMQFRKTGWRETELDWLKKYLGVEGKYPRWADFRRWVIEPAIKEINKSSPYTVSFKTKKNGRAIEKVVFFFGEKSQGELNI